MLPVSVLFNVTDAFGTTAPEESFTVPVSSPVVVVCADKSVDNRHRLRNSKDNRVEPKRIRFISFFPTARLKCCMCFIGASESPSSIPPGSYVIKKQKEDSVLRAEYRGMTDLAECATSVF